LHAPQQRRQQRRDAERIEAVHVAGQIARIEDVLPDIDQPP
jgi:hypothetical protein